MRKFIKKNNARVITILLCILLIATMFTSATLGGESFENEPNEDEVPKENDIGNYRYLGGNEPQDDTTSIFGYAIEGTRNINIQNRICGVWGEAVDGDGTADHIMAFFKAVNGYGNYNGHATAGLYEYVDSSSTFADVLISQTEVKELNINEGVLTWIKFNFTDEKPTIVNNTRYYCVVSAELTPQNEGNLKIMGTKESGYGMWQIINYNDILPNPLEDEIVSEYRRSIYCSYTITEENNPPIAVNDSATMNESEKSIVTKVLKNDYDPDGDIDSTTVKIVDDPLYGKVYVDIIEGKVKYTRNVGIFARSDKFTYIVNDTEGATSNIATVTINMEQTPINNPPVAINDTAIIPENENVVIINVTDNDYDTDGTIDPSTVAIVEYPLNGTLSVDHVTGNVTYTADPDFSGINIFKYTVNDSEGAISNIATVTIRVITDQTHCIPIANDDYYKTPEDVRLDTATPGVLDNDHTLSVSIVDPCPLIAVLENDASHGSLTLNEDGSFAYIPDDNWNGDDTFTYRACTDDQCSEIATVSIKVTSINDAPVAVDDFANMNRDTTVIIHVTQNDNDIEDGEPIINIITRDPENGTVEIIDDLTIQYVSAAGFVGSDSFEYNVKDSGGLTDNATVFITINPIEEPEDPPVPSGGGGVSTPSSPSINHPIADASAGAPYQGFINEEITFDGSLSYVVNGEIISWYWSLGDGTFINGKIVNHSYSSPKVYLVTLTVTDNKGATDTCETIAAIVQPNRPPSTPDIYGPETGTIGTKYSYAALSKDVDGDKIKYVFDWGDGESDETEFFSPPQSSGVSFIHNWDSAGTYVVTITVSDNQTASSSEMSVIITETSLDYIVIIVLGSIMAIFVILSLILVKTGKFPKFGKK